MSNKDLVLEFASKVNWKVLNSTFDGPYITFMTIDTHEKIVAPLFTVRDAYYKYYSF